MQRSHAVSISAAPFLPDLSRLCVVRQPTFSSTPHPPTSTHIHRRTTANLPSLPSCRNTSVNETITGGPFSAMPPPGVQTLTLPTSATPRRMPYRCRACTPTSARSIRPRSDRLTDTRVVAAVPRPLHTEAREVGTIRSFIQSLSWSKPSINRNFISLAVFFSSLHFDVLRRRKTKNIVDAVEGSTFS